MVRVTLQEIRIFRRRLPKRQRGVGYLFAVFFLSCFSAPAQADFVKTSESPKANCQALLKRATDSSTRDDLVILEPVEQPSERESARERQSILKYKMHTLHNAIRDRFLTNLQLPSRMHAPIRKAIEEISQGKPHFADEGRVADLTRTIDRGIIEALDEELISMNHMSAFLDQLITQIRSWDGTTLPTRAGVKELAKLIETYASKDSYDSPKPAPSPLQAKFKNLKKASPSLTGPIADELRILLARDPIAGTQGGMKLALELKSDPDHLYKIYNPSPNNIVTLHRDYEEILLQLDMQDFLAARGIPFVPCEVMMLDGLIVLRQKRITVIHDINDPTHAAYREQILELERRLESYQAEALAWRAERGYPSVWRITHYTTVAGPNGQPRRKPHFRKDIGIDAIRIRFDRDGHPPIETIVNVGVDLQTGRVVLFDW